MDENLAGSCLAEIIEVFKKHKLTAEEILLVYGNLGYSLGASIEGFKSVEKGPSPEELIQMHAKTPYKLGVALMMEGYNITSWVDNLEEAKELEKKEEDDGR